MPVPVVEFRTLRRNTDSTESLCSDPSAKLGYVRIDPVFEETLAKMSSRVLFTVLFTVSA